ncbi:hypothetical protein ACF3MZ_08235 [Paenibacillaceae bacterium WGS1546]|uniref:hypothetical protein n=1 Tax=Cohnella sp. WGS1546 TaxID=3366810 RepID=UPI00372D3D75
MTLCDDEIRKQFKSEADDLLFRDLHFGAELQEKIKRLAEQEGDGRRLAVRRRRRWIAGFAAAAAILGLVLIVDPAAVSKPGGPNTLFVDRPGTIDGNPIDGTPFAEPDDGPRVLSTYEEARAAYGDDLHTPTFVPEGFSLNQISVTGPRNGEATGAVFSYVSPERSFGIFAEKGEASLPDRYTQEVDVNGAVGYLIGGEPSPDPEALAANVELHWRSAGVTYMISGLVTENEAVAIARSMKPYANYDN